MKTLPLVLLLGLSFQAQVQSFGDFLKNAAADAARQAVAGNLRQAVGNAVDSAAQGLTQPGATNAAAPAAAPAALPPGCARMKGKTITVGPRPESYRPASLWPENTCPVYAPGDFKFEQAVAAKHAFVEASKVRCRDCEGGYWPDAWGWRSLVKDSRGANYTDELAKMLLALKEGESLGWKGNRYDGKVTATGAHPIGDMPCRQFRYVLTEQGRQVAQYDSLLCEYVAPFSSKPAWHERV